MAVSISTTPTVPKVDQSATINITGATATTSYVLRIVHPGGGTETHTVKTDGAGAASQVYVPQEGGTVNYYLDPLPSTAGSTGSASGTHGH